MQIQLRNHFRRSQQHRQRLSLTDAEVTRRGSDRLVDAFVVYGTANATAAWVTRELLDARAEQ